MTTIPQQGKTVIFSKVSAGSYLSTGEQYIVERVTKEFIHLVNAKEGCGSYEHTGLFKRTATWEYVTGWESVGTDHE